VTKPSKNESMLSMISSSRVDGATCSSLVCVCERSILYTRPAMGLTGQSQPVCRYQSNVEGSRYSACTHARTHTHAHSHVCKQSLIRLLMHGHTRMTACAAASSMRRYVWSGSRSSWGHSYVSRMRVKSPAMLRTWRAGHEQEINSQARACTPREWGQARGMCIETYKHTQTNKQTNKHTHTHTYSGSTMQQKGRSLDGGNVPHTACVAGARSMASMWCSC
jgi:hypothetical protein